MSEPLHTNLGNIIYIYEILNKYSDVNHILSVKDIIKYVEKEYGESIEDRTVKRNIRVLIEKLNVDISTFKDNRKGYYLQTKDFELSEVQTLIGLIQYSKFIDDFFSKDIVARLKGLLNKYELNLIDEIADTDIYCKNIKTVNKEVLANVEVLLENIKAKNKIEFEYHLYGIDKKLHKVRNEVVSPFAILCENEFLYLVCHSEKYNGYGYYRLDKMKNIKNTNKPIIKLDYSIQEFIESSVYMYGGKKEKVVLKCSMYILDYVIEKFGNDIQIQKIDNNYFKVTLNVCTKGLEMWILQYIKYVEVLKPISLKEKIKRELKGALKKYE